MSIFSGKGIFKGTVVLLISNIAKLFLGLLRFLIVAYYFGTSFTTDAYIIANCVPLFFSAMAESVLNQTFIPVFMEYQKKNERHEAQVLANTVFFVSLFLGTFFTLSVFYIAPLMIPVLAPGFPSATKQLSVQILIYLSPLITLKLLTSYLSSLFYSVDRFLIPAVTDILAILCGIISLIIWIDSMGIIALPVGIIIGTAVQLLTLLITLKKYGLEIGLNISLKHPGLKKIKSLFGPRFLDFSLKGFDLFVDRWFASLLGEGYVSALTYAQKILRVPNLLVLSSLGKTIMPSLAKFSGSGEKEEIKKLVSKSIRMMSFAAIPLIFFIVFFRMEIIHIFFERGAFDMQSTRITAYALLFYAFGTLAYCVSPILKITFFSLQDTITPLKVTAIFVIANVVLDFFLMKVFGHGGIALSTSVVLTLDAFVLWIMLQKKIGSLADLNIFGSITKILIVSLFTCGILKALYSTIVIRDELIWNISKMSLSFVVGGILFLSACCLFNVPEYQEIVVMINQTRKRKKL